MITMTAFDNAWTFLKMSLPPMAGGDGEQDSGVQEEYSHKDLDAEALIDFLVQNPAIRMDYQDAKVLVNHHKTREMAEANQRKARARVAALNDAPEGQQLGMGMNDVFL